ncbi:dTDP-4-amino-4,6-dideoxygalactose transaminase [Flavobacterium luteum]|uniref:dTDP-4-amino-4,6-dideoxygalactose transaminase n=1 Tax=Flavobacterium luteum TaxID=2026654 RepID=A0A7J5AE93_9FLAO|nr:dTDP-4-amino-4,6-dideoxygalactose transaminase [Flavobacterium luteum]KAB1155813.1 dTDP-4-amino-4,6-dideoxygalactose transaminase [Flavobacterium luteum]
MNIPFNKVYITGNEEKYMLEALYSGKQCGNHGFCTKVIDLMKAKHGFNEVFLVPSGTAALEMGAVLANIAPGDEVILPSYTFSSTVNAVVLFGAIPVFCESEPETMNIDASKIEALITPRTKMILPIDYAGVSCEIDLIMEIANRHNLIVMQDCAQSYGTYFKGKAAGSQAHLATFSFHETKNFSAGEGGALVVNVPEWEERAHFIQEKGTDRRLVLNGVKNKYSWVDKGSSYLLSDILAAMLLAQLEQEDKLKSIRSNITKAYFDLFAPYEKKGFLSYFKIKDYIDINHHAFWVIFDTVENQQFFMAKLRDYKVSAYIGYLALHSAPKGLEYGYKESDLPITQDLTDRIVRMPFYTELGEQGLEYCMESMKKVLDEMYS